MDPIILALQFLGLLALGALVFNIGWNIGYEAGVLRGLQVKGDR